MTKEYLGQASNTFKLRFNGHSDSFRNEKKEMATTLSKHIWKLKWREVELDLCQGDQVLPTLQHGEEPDCHRELCQFTKQKVGAYD